VSRQESHLNQRADAKTHGAERGLDRFEGFSDAVFAIALTLLIVEIKVPGSPEGPHGYSNLAGAMAEQWREYLALILCYVVIGAYWLQHHYSGRIYAKSDHWFGACTWMAKWFYGKSGQRLMDERLAHDFVQQMTRRYGIATLIQIAAVAVAIVVPRIGVGIALLCVAFFLLPQPKPRYNPGEEPSPEEKSNG